MLRPPGLYEELLTRGFARELAELESQGFTALQSSLSVGEAHALLARYLLRLLTRALSTSQSDENTNRQLEVARRVHAALSALDADRTDPNDALQEPPRVLSAILPPPSGLTSLVSPIRPEIPLTSSDLLVNARGEPRVGTPLRPRFPPPTESTSSAHSSAGMAFVSSTTLSYSFGRRADLSGSSQPFTRAPQNRRLWTA